MELTFYLLFASKTKGSRKIGDIRRHVMSATGT
jgi:hypothetical protein